MHARIDFKSLSKWIGTNNIGFKTDTGDTKILFE